MQQISLKTNILCRLDELCWVDWAEAWLPTNIFNKYFQQIYSTNIFIKDFLCRLDKLCWVDWPETWLPTIIFNQYIQQISLKQIYTTNISTTNMLCRSDARCWVDWVEALLPTNIFKKYSNKYFLGRLGVPSYVGIGVFNKYLTNIFSAGWTHGVGWRPGCQQIFSTNIFNKYL